MIKYIGILLLSTTLTAIEPLKVHVPLVTYGEPTTRQDIGEVDQSAQVIMPELKGITITSRQKVLSEEGEIAIEGVSLPGPENSLKERLMPFIGQPVTLNTVQEIRKTVTSYYYRYHHPIVDVSIPEQALSSGRLTVIVKEAKVGNVCVKGNKHFKENKIASSISMDSGEEIDTYQLIQDLNWINRNPFRDANAIFSPSTTEGYTDLDILLEDQFPLRVFAGVDNAGYKETGRTRFFAGFNWGNVFGLDHILSYQFTTGTDYSKFWSHSGQYVVPLPWRHVFSMFGGYSRVKTDISTFPGMKTDGYSAQASARYEIPIPFPRSCVLQQIEFGFDYKRSNTNLDFEGDFVFGQPVNITELMAGYRIGVDNDWSKLSFVCELFYSPGKWLGDQGNSVYSRLRPRAKTAFAYVRGAIEPVLYFPWKFSLYGSYRFQVASGNLLASEQFGLGGYNTVRGYDERIVNGDHAVLISNELRTPPIHFFKLKEGKIQDELLFLVFLDYGIGFPDKPTSGEKHSEYLIGIGPGVRYMILPYLTFRGDLGFKMHKVPGDDQTLRFNFQLVASY